MQLQNKRGAFKTIATPADFLDGGNHPPIAAKRRVGDGNEPWIGGRGWRIGSHRLRDLGLIAMRA